MSDSIWLTPEFDYGTDMEPIEKLRKSYDAGAVIERLAAAQEAQCYPDADIAEATDIAVCPDEAPETGSFDYPALHAALNRGESLDRDTAHALLWRVKALERENARLFRANERLHEIIERLDPESE